MAEQDKVRYQDELNHYTPDPEFATAASSKKAKKKKDPNAPKRPQNAYMLYSHSVRAQIRADNPNLAFGQVAQVISQQFKALSKQEIEEWNQKAQEDEKRYEAETKSYVPPPSEEVHNHYNKYWNHALPSISIIDCDEDKERDNIESYEKWRLSW